MVVKCVVVSTEKVRSICVPIRANVLQEAGIDINKVFSYI